MVKILIYAYIFHPKKTPNRGVNFKVTAINRNGSIPFHTILGHISNPLTTDRVSRGAYRTGTAGHVVSLYVCRPRMTHCPWARHVPYPLELSGWLGFYSARDKSLVPCGRSLQHFGTQSERQHHRKLVPFVFEPIVCGCRQSPLLRRFAPRWDVTHGVGILAQYGQHATDVFPGWVLLVGVEIERSRYRIDRCHLVLAIVLLVCHTGVPS